ncbi:hypothetical protein [Streptococcus vestibularis]|uniref:hypothetical protein n=1 Tax=Streptococcus vestibularis TaxID=1343 RepID=UPI002671F34A|nr:hypothetical protein [Streptococcus vestibularis]
MEIKQGGQKYYSVLIQISIQQIIWLVHQENGKIAWSDNFKDVRFFSSYEKAKKTVEEHFLEAFGFIGSYKIIEFTRQELIDFDILTLE